MKTEYTKLLVDLCRQEFSQEVKPELARPDEQFGDYSTNLAMQLAKKLHKSPPEIAEKIAAGLRSHPDFAEVNVAGSGFINIKLEDQVLFEQARVATSLAKPLRGKKIVAEYSDPNPFKVLHAGHLYTSLVGDAIANIIEMAGAEVHRVNFGGDVGLHVAKTMWAIIHELGGEHPEKLAAVEDSQKLEWVSNLYVVGNNAYSSDDRSKAEIIETNKRVYQLHSDKDKTSPFAQIYWTCRQWSYDGFNALYERLGMKPFEKYYPESDVSDLGVEIIRRHIGKVYEESDGAVIFRGEPYGLFTQVFINSAGLSTYGGKDVGLIQQKYNDYHYDASFIITDASQKDHLAVVMKSIEQYQPELVQKTIHRTHGRIKLADGSKMSSRGGLVVTAADVLSAAFSASQQNDELVVVGAVRYSFLRTRIGSDIVYDPVESVSQEGNSGPYLQYALVRGRSILNKLEAQEHKTQKDLKLDKFERSLVRKLGLYPEAFEIALNEYSPHHIANYLYELAVVFNRFYENSRVAGDPRESLRAEMVRSYVSVLSEGLGILGMPKPEKM